MKAAEARKTAAAWHRQAQRDHEVEYKATMAREKKHAAAVWKERGAALVTKIDGWDCEGCEEWTTRHLRT